MINVRLEVCDYMCTITNSPDIIIHTTHSSHPTDWAQVPKTLLGHTFLRSLINNLGNSAYNGTVFNAVNFRNKT